ncbi:hypothetical protein THF1C08_320010 [Vibrio jasicida]|uniref:Uncharacterized protein n=1 Tax=Vibrio jasicida TaxID=766224 RepID=A0AAU9QPY2_9VIBR|nr:hypothetical protein THF1C08_320010 [Vibrio jasicida]CAH1597320.1 hypothetical protein THF1A12_320009 [Vibrio jasicida]
MIVSPLTIVSINLHYVSVFSVDFFRSLVNTDVPHDTIPLLLESF